MKNSFGSKLDKAIVKAKNDLYRVMDGIQLSAKELASGDFETPQQYQDILDDICNSYKEYLMLKQYIELLEDAEEGF